LTAIQYRAPELADVDSLAQVHVTCWREAYAGIVDAEYLATLSVETRAANWRKSLHDPEVFCCMAVDGDVVAGFISSGPARAAVSQQVDGEIYAIYLLQNYHQQGIGKHFFDLAIGDWKSRGGQGLGLLVLDDNIRAVRFYERQGMRDIGRVECEIGERKLMERLCVLHFSRI
jgi:ribosomal protein S18 acetylase RimI-like enzyme